MNKKFAVLGDVILDEYYSGNACRLSPEAPVPIISNPLKSSKLGGAANVALNLSSLGATVHIYGIVGNDLNAKAVEDELAAIKIKAFFLKSKKSPTITKKRYIANDSHILRCDYEKPFQLEDSTNLELKLIDNLNKYNYDGVIISDYDKGTFHSQSELIKKIKDFDEKILIYVDPKKDSWKCYSYADFITPNILEFKKNFKDLPYKEGATKAYNNLNIQNILLTKSENGMTLFSLGKEKLSIKPINKKIVDVTGAGDTVLASFAYKFLITKNTDESMRFANKLAGDACMHIGTYSPMNYENKKQKKIVFTNGCFDFIHLGHMEYLKKASMLGDYLIVGLNSDVSVKKLKGPSRPVNNETFRKKMLLKLEYVNEVIIFNEETPLELIKKINPDILAKGGDYIAEKIIGYDFVTKNGGVVAILDFLEGYSTTNIINSKES